ncbi:MAG: glycoside hydrolase, partial [Planctomycetes bacterium]|nr:glycoside hydrolase [Planctomycetota bacterium]
TPQLWMPDTGEIHSCKFDRDNNGNTRVPLRLAPYGSVFVVFRDKAEDLPMAERYPVSGDGWQLTGPWEVRFPEGWGAPPSKTFDRLVSWTDVEDEGVKYFSGVASYHNTFDISADQLTPGKRIVLDLGEVRFVTEVYVNGQSQGTLWKPPFQIEITDAVRAGTNQLVVEVANTWSNRLVGDAQSPDGPKFCRTNIDRSLTWQVPWKDTPLLDSGLLGPVRLIEWSE